MSIHEDRSTRSDAPPSLDKVARKLQSTRDQVRTLIDKIILMENLDVVRTIKINELESMVLSQQRETAELSLSLAELRQQVVNGKEHDDEYDNMSNRFVDSLDSPLQNLKISEHIDDGVGIPQRGDFRRLAFPPIARHSLSHPSEQRQAWERLTW